MATHGEIVPLQEYFDTPGNAAPGAVGLIQPGQFTHGADGGYPSDSIVTEVLLETPSYFTLYAHRLWSFLDDFYFHVYISPISLQYGTFSQDKTLTMRIWNAFFTETDFTSATAFGTDVHFDQAPFLPIHFNPLGYQIVTFTADGEGDTILSDEFSLVFDTENEDDEVIAVPVSGFRTPSLTDLVWKFSPNWSTNFEVTYEYKTDIIVAASGREQRRQVRQTPRKSMNFTIALKNSNRRIFREQMTGNQHGRFYVPEYTRYVTTTVDAGADEIVFTVDTLPPWWLSEHNNYVILHYGDQWSLRRIDFVGSDSNSDEHTVYFKTDDSLVWPAGTKIYPAIQSWLKDEISSTLLTSAVQQAQMEFIGLPGIEALEPATTPTNFIDGRELWLKKPNWATPPSVTDYRPTTFIDFGWGRMDRVSDIQHQGQRLVLAYTGRNFAEAEELRQFYVRCAGQLHEFYMPTWQPDIDLERPIGALDLELFISGADLGAFYSQDLVRLGAGLAIVKTDQTIVYAQIADIFADVDSNSQEVSIIALKEALGEDIALEDIDMVCWMPLWRHATDTLTVGWTTDGVCQLSFTVQTQPWLPADIDDSNSDVSSNSEGF